MVRDFRVWKLNVELLAGKPNNVKVLEVVAENIPWHLRVGDWTSGGVVQNLVVYPLEMNSGTFRLTDNQRWLEKIDAA